MPLLAESEYFYFARRLEAGREGMFPMLGLIPGDGVTRYQIEVPVMSVDSGAKWVTR